MELHWLWVSALSWCSCFLAWFSWSGQKQSFPYHRNLTTGDRYQKTFTLPLGTHLWPLNYINLHLAYSSCPLLQTPRSHGFLKKLSPAHREIPVCRSILYSFVPLFFQLWNRLPVSIISSSLQSIKCTANHYLMGSLTYPQSLLHMLILSCSFPLCSSLGHCYSFALYEWPSPYPLVVCKLNAHCHLAPPWV